jgi:hypothetical protein
MSKSACSGFDCLTKILAGRVVIKVANVLWSFSTFPVRIPVGEADSFRILQKFL